jgi:anti-sigma regulatory factor (Ser/Thr protein kinase)
MELLRRLDLEQEPASVGAARRFVREVLQEWGAADPDDNAALVASELVTNALHHARGPISLFMARRLDRIVLSVTDGSTTVPSVEVPGLLAESGRGLALVQSLTRAWGEEVLPEGKRVWAEVPAAVSQR